MLRMSAFKIGHWLQFPVNADHGLSTHVGDLDSIPCPQLQRYPAPAIFGVHRENQQMKAVCLHLDPLCLSVSQKNNIELICRTLTIVNVNMHC